MKYNYNYPLALPNNSIPRYQPRFNVSFPKRADIEVDRTVYQGEDKALHYLDANLVHIWYVLAWELITLAAWRDTKTREFFDCYPTARIFEEAWSDLKPKHLSEVISFGQENTTYRLVKITKAENIGKAVSMGYPVIVGGSVYESFTHAADSGVVPMPRIGERLLGGHAFCLVNYDTTNKSYRAIANFGPNFGVCGDIIVASSYLRNLDICRDFFTVQQV